MTTLRRRAWLCGLVAPSATLYAQSPVRGPWPVSEAPPELRAVISRADLVVASMQDALLRELNAALAQGGPAHAMQSCHIDVVALTQRVARQEGVAAGRTSDRLRSPTNAPRAWAAPLVAAYAGRPAHEVEGFVADLGKTVGVLRPIAHRPLCAACHGPGRPDRSRRARSARGTLSGGSRDRLRRGRDQGMVLGGDAQASAVIAARLASADRAHTIPVVAASIEDVEAALRVTPIFRKLAPADRRHVAEAATVRHYRKGEIIFEQEAPSEAFYTIATGRVKIFRMLPTGKDLILEVFGPGDPLGAIAVYNERPFPASAAALEDAVCVVIPRNAFFRLLEQHPSLVRGLLLGMTTRLVELTNRLTELSAGRIEPRIARLFLKLAKDMGREERGGTFVPLALSRQELADMVGTTIETCIRIMSRWGKRDIVRTERDGFVIADMEALETTAEE